MLILDQDTMRTYWSRKIYVDESQQQYSIHVTHILLAKFSVVVIRGIVHNDSIMLLLPELLVDRIIGTNHSL